MNCRRTIAQYCYPLLLVALATLPAAACGPYDTQPRPHNQEEVDRLMATRALILENHRELLQDLEADPAQREFILTQIEQIDALLDEVGNQYGCATSGLYWHTDLESAMATAAETGKPILSLRMLGNLTDELSCANSRFFRTALYANEEISALLRENFVLHWESVRPVPVITIDFGDGRVLQRTVTGNSAHYMLTPDGQPVDLLPGLYGPAAFSAWLEDAGELAQQATEFPEEAREALLVDYHERKLAGLQESFQADLTQILFPNGQPAYAIPASGPNGDLLVTPQLPLAEAHELNEDHWRQIGWLHADDALLDDASVQAIADQNPTALAAGELAITKAIAETPLVRMVRNLEGSIALDTVRNEYLLHAQIHQWFAEGTVPAELPYFTEQVYADLFLTPASDPWLGLAPPDTYTGLEDGGLSIEGVRAESGFLLRAE